MDGEESWHAQTEVILGGDAASVHSSAGGQGTNAGIPGAVELGEALGAALRAGKRGFAGRLRGLAAGEQVVCFASRLVSHEPAPAGWSTEEGLDVREGGTRWKRAPPCLVTTGQMARTCEACGPFWPCVISNSTRWPSSRLR
ncbi:FAD-dependent monooxygenase [Nonomuraea sp. NPDC046570]|uniref:FAD-dependent monooxygenase n=1 Tax=Nonomuraea sp. NPDC046570 TaxID=3155255 RepID=UPI0033CFFDFA